MGQFVGQAAWRAGANRGPFRVELVGGPLDGHTFLALELRRAWRFAEPLDMRGWRQVDLTAHVDLRETRYVFADWNLSGGGARYLYEPLARRR